MPLKQAMVYCYCYTYFDDNSLVGTRSGIQGYSNHIMSKTYKKKLYLLAINFQRQKQAFIISILPTNRRGSHLLNWSIDACQGWGLIIYWSWYKKKLSWHKTLPLSEHWTPGCYPFHPPKSGPGPERRRDSTFSGQYPLLWYIWDTHTCWRLRQLINTCC